MCLLSTFHKSNEIVETSEETTNDDEERVRVTCKIPTARKFYLSEAGAIDQANSNIMQYSWRHTIIRWRTALFFWFFRLACNNAMIIWSHGQEKETNRTFLELLCKEIIASTKKDLPTQHQLVGQQKVKLCVICLQQKKRSTTTFRCSTCDVAIHRDCFLQTEIHEHYYKNVIQKKFAK
eukprot:Pompholyxophrys_sp_v1_NODE_83_length_2221_cov_2.980157.p2 type:complete len:179 gc:universal NODE_83_length_2221_cov_2.980157:1453-1989(+)